MAPASLSSIPPEVLCQIFQYADDFSVVSALARTSRIFYNTWRQNPTAICKVVAPRVVLNLADAERFVAIQEKVEAWRLDNSDYDRAILRAKSLLFIARYPPIIGEDWRETYEPALIAQAFYCILTIGVMEKARYWPEDEDEIMAKFDPADLCYLQNLEIRRAHYDKDDYRCLDLDKIWKYGCTVIYRK